MYYVGFKWSCKIHILFKCFRHYSYYEFPCVVCAPHCNCKQAHTAAPHWTSPPTLCPSSHAANRMFTIKMSTVFVCCLTEPQTGTLDSVQWCLINANALNRPIEKFSNDCLLCLCVAMTVKPLFDHSQWILLRQSFTSTPTVISICCYLKESPPIYNGLSN